MNAETKQELFDYLGNELDAIALESNLFEIEKIIQKWKPISEQTPFDRDYLCYIERKNECGTVSHYQIVVQNRLNKFILMDNEKILSWMELPEIPF